MVNKDDELKRFAPLLDDVYIATDSPGSDVLIINYDHYGYLDYNTIEHLYNNNKVKCYFVSLCISKWFKEQFKMLREKTCKLEWWQFIDIRYRGYNITGTTTPNNTNIYNENKSYNTITSNIGRYSSKTLISNDNKDNDNRINYKQTSMANNKSIKKWTNISKVLKR